MIYHEDHNINGQHVVRVDVYRQESESIVHTYRGHLLQNILNNTFF